MLPKEEKVQHVLVFNLLNTILLECRLGIIYLGFKLKITYP
ncbi:hypothetical protein PCARR_a3056 [Pseudoalteromonas carrageenovora IAM 12662]|uniref:Uncharacterized protein n=1 Tax=Pseudoalteromonas carrageenovora IAM 12662 TaxID=1314868 RepID=A0ABR9EM19_PSEVC|nr:hypothetical protein [Pseudoalteromonas carrageenovora IAM 12662]